MKIVLDTNFLMIPSKFKVDIFSEIKRICNEYELIIVDKTLFELQKLSENKGEKGISARVALKLIDNKIRILATREKHADDAIIGTLHKGDVVATQDKKLKERAKAKGCPVITMKNKSYLDINL